MFRKTIRYPLKVYDIGDDKTQICDGEDFILIYENIELTFNQWTFIVECLNQAGEQGKYIPTK